jgi:hypothetical protein
MSKYEELYKHAKYVFDEEVSRFARVEDKAARFITVVTSLLAVYALTGRQLFPDLIPADNCTAKLLLLLAALVLVGLLASWGFAFHALHVQGLKKAPLNEKLLSFYNDNELINIYYGMAKQFSVSLEHNRSITDLKAQRIKRSFWCIVATVTFFTLFIIASAVNANFEKPEVATTEATFPKGNDVKLSYPDNPDSQTKEETKMSENGNDGDTQKAPAQPADPAPQTPERPDLDIVAPEFDIVTESFDPSKLPNGKVSKD